MFELQFGSEYTVYCKATFSTPQRAVNRSNAPFALALKGMGRYFDSKSGMFQTVHELVRLSEPIQDSASGSTRTPALHSMLTQHLETGKW